MLDLSFPSAAIFLIFAHGKTSSLLWVAFRFVWRIRLTAILVFFPAFRRPFHLLSDSRGYHFLAGHRAIPSTSPGASIAYLTPQPCLFWIG